MRCQGSFSMRKSHLCQNLRDEYIFHQAKGTETDFQEERAYSKAVLLKWVQGTKRVWDGSCGSQPPGGWQEMRLGGCRGPGHASPHGMLRPWSVAVVKWCGDQPSRALMNSVSITWTASVSWEPRARLLGVAYNFALCCQPLEAYQGVGCALKPSPWSLLILSIVHVFRIGRKSNIGEFFF